MVFDTIKLSTSNQPIKKEVYYSETIFQIDEIHKH